MQAVEGVELERQPLAGHMSCPWPAASAFSALFVYQALPNRVFLLWMSSFCLPALVWTRKEKAVVGLTAGPCGQVAGDGNSAAHVYPDQSLYPSNSVPLLVERINNALQRADQVQACTSLQCACS